MSLGSLVDDARLAREGDADWLSLALLDARNHTLRWLAAFEARGALVDATGGRTALALVADAARHARRWTGGDEGGAAPPDGDALRALLARTMDVTLERLSAAAGDGLHVFRDLLLHEDRLGEALAELAAERQLPEGGDAPPPWRALAAHAERQPLWFPPQRWWLGSERGGTVPANEHWAHEVDVPEFEIDALPVTWNRYAEFSEDGGYDRRELWSLAGWAWLQGEGRRAPRHVEQLRGGVLVRRRGQIQRVPARQPVLHVARHEAEAWCRWAGRRLPTEPEWEIAALRGASRGFGWGEVFEWVAGSARAWPGHQGDAPGTLDRIPPAGAAGVLRGASWMTRPRRRHPKARRFAPPTRDTMFCGFRSCAL